jgi:hypothetical protein
MIRAMVIKELRETWWIAAIALALYLCLVKSLTSTYDPQNGQLLSWLLAAGTTEVPFVGGQFTRIYFLISILLALALGFRQSLAESTSGAYLFLLHRPWPRAAFFSTKLAVGAGLFWLCAAVPILIYAFWAATPGNVPAPFEWSMTLDAWWYWLELPLLYMAAFLCGLRPASWFGTRLLPLAAIGLALILFSAPWVWWLPVVGLVAMYAVVIFLICDVAQTRDYS